MGFFRVRSRPASSRTFTHLYQPWRPLSAVYLSAQRADRASPLSCWSLFFRRLFSSYCCLFFCSRREQSRQLVQVLRAIVPRRFALSVRAAFTLHPGALTSPVETAKTGADRRCCTLAPLAPDGTLGSTWYRWQRRHSPTRDIFPGCRLPLSRARWRVLDTRIIYSSTKTAGNAEREVPDEEVKDRW